MIREETLIHLRAASCDKHRNLNKLVKYADLNERKLI